jgi:AraC family transcriptional regulator
MRNSHHGISLVSNFPDPASGKFSREEWVSQFDDSNVIIHTRSKEVYYPAHWGPLSIKTAFGGNEYYQKERCKYAVSEHNFLVLNEGTRYSSYIEPGDEVESLTINFHIHYQSEVARTVLSGTDKMIDDPFAKGDMNLFFEEKLFGHNQSVSPFIYTIRKLTQNFNKNQPAVNETLYFLLEALLLNNRELIHKIKEIDARRFSTQKEIYRRLNAVKDYIDSCFNEEITLDELSKIALMSPFHLLRQFKKNYRQTPHQYLTARRLEKARSCIVYSKAPLTDICFSIGFSDISSFSKLFKRKFGLSPQQYRIFHQK